MAINCNQDGLLKKVDEAKAALKAKMANIKLPDVDVEAALAELAADAEALKTSLLASIPEIPKLPDFQGELDALKTKITARLPGWEKDLQKFEKAWGGAIDNIGEIVETLSDPIKLLNFDICKQEDVELNADGTKKEKPIEAVDDTTAGEEEPKPDAVISPLDSGAGSFSGSDVSATRHQFAKEAIHTAYKVAMEELVRIKDTARGQMAGANKKGLVTIKMKGRLPKNFFRNSKYLNAPVLEYFLINEVLIKDNIVYADVKASSADPYYENMSELNAMKEMIAKVGVTYKMIMSYFEEGGQVEFANIKTKETQDAIAEHYYKNHGYGLYGSGYGYYMASICISKEAKQRIRPAFNLTVGDYRASKKPIAYAIEDYINGYDGDKNNDFANIMEEVVRAIFNATDQLGEPALAVYGAYNHGTTIADMKSQMPAAEDFLPKALGGSIENFETSEKFIQSDIVEPSKAGNYTEENFVPHWMYKTVTAFGFDRPSQVFANTYQEHQELQQAGWGHEKPNSPY